MEDVTANKRKMKELEDNLLYKLTSTKVSELTSTDLVMIDHVYYDRKLSEHTIFLWAIKALFKSTWMNLSLEKIKCMYIPNFNMLSLWKGKVAFIYVLLVLTTIVTYSKMALSKRPKIVFQDQLSLNAGQKYCRVLQLDHQNAPMGTLEHFAILLTFIKIPIFVLSIFEWPFYTGFIVSLNLFTILIFHWLFSLM